MQQVIGYANHIFCWPMFETLEETVIKEYTAYTRPYWYKDVLLSIYGFRHNVRTV